MQTEMCIPHFLTFMFSVVIRGKVLPELFDLFAAHSDADKILFSKGLKVGLGSVRDVTPNAFSRFCRMFPWAISMY